MNIKFRYIQYSVISVLLLFFGSCTKFVELDPPSDRVSSEILFSDSVNAESAIAGLYIEFITPVTSPDFFNGGLTLYTGMAGDELIPFNPGEDYVPFYKNDIPVTNFLNNDRVWKPAYHMIYRANACIEGCTKSTQLVESLKKRLIAEAKFFRAYSYFYLLNIYADVPLITGTDFKVNESKPRVPITEVYNQIIKDLSEAEADLQLSNESSERVRVDKAVVQAFLARVYLYTKNWSDAEIAANNIIDNPNYVLETDLDQAFASSGREAIFRLMPANPGFETPEGFLFVPSNSSTIPKYYISESLLSSFSAEDKRREHWLNKNTVNGTDYYYPYKYKTRRQSQPSSDFTERYNVLRLAETYLIRAEARAQQDKVDDGLEDLNRIRGRAGLQDTTLSGKDELLAAIFNERRLELFAEGAHRWLDMKRTDRIDAIMPAVAVIKGTTWSPEDKLWPIPFYQIQSNPALTQNPGYQ